MYLNMFYWAKNTAYAKTLSLMLNSSQGLKIQMKLNINFNINLFIKFLFYA